MASTIDDTAPLAVTLPIAARKLGISQSHIRRLVKSRAIRTVRAGRLIIFPIAAIDDFLAGKSAA